MGYWGVLWILLGWKDVGVNGIGIGWGCGGVMELVFVMVYYWVFWLSGWVDWVDEIL